MIAPKLFDIAFTSPTTAMTIVRTLLDDLPPAKALVCGASVHLPRSGSIWVASFTGPSGGQVWKSTGLTDQDQALVLARRWEAEARAQRLKLGRPARKPTLRVRRDSPGAVRSGLLTQKQVALLLNMSERGVREVERRIKEATFPVLKTIESFDFKVQPSINEPLVRELLRGEYLTKKENVLLVGNAGTGKTHRATALGFAACSQGKRVRCYTTTGLVWSTTIIPFC